MALKELHLESPSVTIGEGGRQETRVFSTTDLNDIPNRGSVAQVAFSGFTTGLTIETVSWNREGNNESGAPLYRVEIIAAMTILPESEQEEVPPDDLAHPIWFEVESELSESTITVDGVEYDATWPNVLITVQIRRRYTVRSLPGMLNSIAASMGAVNNADDMPFTGAVSGEWRLTGAPMDHYAPGKFETIWTYTHAGKDVDGNRTTWSAKAQTDYAYFDRRLNKKVVSEDTKPTFPLKNINPRISNVK